MAQFVVMGMDGLDDGALERRLAVREAHLAYTDAARLDGKIKLAVAVQDDAVTKSIGSILLVEMDSKADVEAYVAQEPYVLGNVWQEVTIYPAAVPPMFRI